MSPKFGKTGKILLRKNVERRARFFCEKMARRARFFNDKFGTRCKNLLEKICHDSQYSFKMNLDRDRQDFLQSIWSDGHESSMTNLARRARFLAKNGSSDLILLRQIENNRQVS